MTLGQRLHAARFAKGYRMREVERLTGVSPATISRVERDSTNIESNALFRLAGCYGVSVGSLLGEEEATMDNLQLANGMMVAYAEKVERHEINYAIGTWFTDAAQAYAAIAQAEAAERQATALERIADALYADNVFDTSNTYSIAQLVYALQRIAANTQPGSVAS